MYFYIIGIFEKGLQMLEPKGDCNSIWKFYFYAVSSIKIIGNENYRIDSQQFYSRNLQSF